MWLRRSTHRCLGNLVIILCAKAYIDMTSTSKSYIILCGQYTIIKTPNKITCFMSLNTFVRQMSLFHLQTWPCPSIQIMPRVELYIHSIV